MVATVNASTSAGVVVTSDTSGSLALQTASTTAVTIDTSQNVGIGTSSPDQKLAVAGRISISGSGYTVSSTNGLIGAYNGNMYVQMPSGNNLQIWKSTTDAVATFDQSGNLGLGVTPSAWSSTLKPMEIGNIGTYIAGRPSGNQIDIGVNNYYNAGFKYANTGVAATLYEQTGGSHAWSYAASGTAGNAITFTQAMTLDASGNLGIGVTSPTSALYVAAQSDTAGGAGITLGNTTTNRRWLTRFGTNSDLGYYLDFYDGSSWNTRLALTYTGNLLVGTTSSAGRLTINGSTADSTANCVSFRDSSSTSLFIVRDDGRISTGGALSPYSNTTASAANMYVDASGIFYRSTSSLKYKTNVENATHGLADVLKLRPVTYQSKATEDGQIIYGGLIAEEVDAAGLKEFVQYAPDGSPDALAYGNMVSLCIKAIQELSAQVTELKAEVQAFKGA